MPFVYRKIAPKFLAHILALICTGFDLNAQGEFDDIPLVDTHIHLYDTQRPQGVPWPPKNDAILYKPTLPEHFRQHIEKNKIIATVVVEASDRFEDNKWVLDITEDESDHYTGLVGNLAVGTPGFATQLTEMSQSKRFVGIRIRPNVAVKSFSQKFWLDLKLLAESNLTLDILVGKITLTQVAEIAKRNPKLKIVVNHLAGLKLRKAGAFSRQWKEELASIASHKNVHMKISALFQASETATAPRQLSYYKPCLDFLVSKFGEDRIIYGSNWPASNKFGSYDDIKPLLLEFCKDRDRQFTEKLFYKNAIEFYNLTDRVILK
jgi:L-fuconolactonase